MLASRNYPFSLHFFQVGRTEELSAFLCDAELGPPCLLPAHPGSVFVGIRVGSLLQERGWFVLGSACVEWAAQAARSGFGLG